MMQTFRLKQSCIKTTVKHSCLWYGAVFHLRVRNLVKIDFKMTGASYINILDEHLNDSVAKIGLGLYIIQHDNDPRHASCLAPQYFETKSI